jgi:hypothetical protein
MLKWRIVFLSEYTGFGWMYVDQGTMTVVKITDDEDNELPNYPPYSYKVVE